MFTDLQLTYMHPVYCSKQEWILNSIDLFRNSFETQTSSSNTAIVEYHETEKAASNSVSMCYRVVTHTMRCDVRPIISDGEILYIDPFAEPISCWCFNEHSARPWLQCDTHGCCMTYSKMEWCPEVHSCNDVIELHRYEQARRQTRNIWASHPASQWSIPMCPSELEKWCGVRTLEDCLFMGNMPDMATSPPVLNTAILNLVSAGRILIATQATLDKLLQDIDARKAMHEACHGEACERVLNEWECVSRQPIETAKALAEQMRGVVTKQRELFHGCWALIEFILRGDTNVEELFIGKFEVVMDS